MEKEKRQSKQSAGTAAAATLSPEGGKKKKFEMPDTWIVVFLMVVIAAILSWVIPAGSYDYVQKEINGSTRNLAIEGSFHYLEEGGTPTGFLGIFSALYTGCVEAGSTIFMILCCCACFRIMVQTGAFHAGIGAVMRKLGKRTMVLAAVLMVLFGLCGSVFGMISELYGFYPLIVGLGIAMGYDAMFGFAILALGEYIGFTCGTLNPYNVAISQGIAELQIYSGMTYRWIIFAVMIGLCILYVLRYGAKIRNDPSKSILYGRPCMHSFSDGDLDQYKMNTRFALVLVDLVVTLAVLMVGLLKFGWGNKQLCGLFIIMSIVAALICSWKPQKYVDEFVSGCRGMLWGALIAGLSRGILVVMNDAMIVDTIIHALADLLQHAPSWLSAQLMFLVQAIINLPIPSSTGQAAVTMPIMAPLADALGLSRGVACLAYQLASGVADLVYPTAGIVIVCGLSDIPYQKWLKWFMPLFAILVVACMLLLAGAVLTNQ